MAQAVSSVNDSGRQPSVGVSACVFLKPTSPCSAAGTRIEPRVSEPSAAQAAPVATDDRAAGGRAAGDARRGVQRQRAGVGRRAVVRVDADAGEGELGQVGVADQRRAGGAQARHGGAVGGGRRGVGHRLRCRRAGRAGDVEQVLHRHRQPGQRAAAARRRRAAASTAAAAARAMASKRRTKAGGRPARRRRRCARSMRLRPRSAGRPPMSAAAAMQVVGGRRVLEFVGLLMRSLRRLSQQPATPQPTTPRTRPPNGAAVLSTTARGGSGWSSRPNLRSNHDRIHA